MRSNILRRLAFLPPLLLGVAVLVLTVSNRPAPARKPPEEQAKAVRVLPVQPLTLKPRIVGYGTVRAANTWAAIAQVGGRVVFVHPQLKAGALIRKGEEIITIAPDDYRVALARAQAGLRALEVKLRELEVNERNTRDLLALEREALRIAEADLQRRKTLLERGTISRTAYEQVLKATIAQRKLVASLENTLRLIPVQREELKAQVESARGQVETARLNLQRTHVRMPFDGRIVEVNVEEQQFVPAGRQMAVADAVAAAEVRAQVPLERMRAVIALLGGGEGRDVRLTAQRMQALAEEFGLSVEVRLPDGGETPVWRGRFMRLAEAVDAKTRTIGVIGEVEDPYGHVRPGERPPLTRGMFVRMDVLTKELPDSIVLPRSALRQGDMVFVADAENRLRLRKVKVLARLGGLVVIGGGLKAGERVVLSDIAPAIEGQLLAPQVDEAALKRLRQAALRGDGR